MSRVAQALGVSRSNLIERGNAIALAVAGTVSDFTLPPNPNSVFECVMRFSFVQADLGAALHIAIDQPPRDE